MFGSRHFESAICWSKSANKFSQARENLALANYGQVLESLSNSGDPESLLLKGIAYAALNDDTSAQVALDTACRMRPNDLEAIIWRWYFFSHWKKHAAQGVSVMQALKSKERNNASVAAVYGRCLFKSGKVKEGLEQMKLACAADSRNILSKEILAEAYVDQLDSARALAALTKLTTLYPRLPEPLLRRGQVYEVSGKADLAIADYSKVLDLNKRCGLAYYRRARVYLRQNAPRKALDDCAKGYPFGGVPSLTSKFLSTRITAARKLGLTKDAVEAAEVLFKDIDQQRFIDRVALNGLLDLTNDYINLKQFQKAMGVVAIIQRFKPDNTYAKLLKANIYCKLGQYKEALDNYDDLISTDSQIPQWHRERAAVLSKMGKQTAAQSDIKRAQELEKGL